MSEKKQYVVRLMMAKCSLGTMDNYLNVDYDHGIIFGVEGQPLMNANDHVSGVHVVHFGKCQSNANPGNMVTSTLKSIPFVGNIIGAVENVVGCVDCKCSPKTFVPWINCNDAHIVEGAPVLTTDSKLPCFYGGIISIVEEPVEAEGVAEEETQ